MLTNAWLNATRIPPSSMKCATRMATLSVFVRGLLMYRFDQDRCRFVISLFTRPTRGDFYCQVLDMKEVERTDRSSIFVSDGYLNLALLYQRKEEPIGLNHFGFHVKSNEEMQTRAEQAGVGRGAARPERIPFAEYRVHDPEGNGIDISQKGWRV